MAIRSTSWAASREGGYGFHHLQLREQGLQAQIVGEEFDRMKLVGFAPVFPRERAAIWLKSKSYLSANKTSRNTPSITPMRTIFPLKRTTGRSWDEEKSAEIIGRFRKRPPLYNRCRSRQPETVFSTKEIGSAGEALAYAGSGSVP